MSDLLKETEIARKKLETAVEWNFGHIGNDHECNKKLNELKDLEERLRTESHTEWNSYQDKYY